MIGFFDGFTFWMRGWRVLVGERSLILLAIIPFTIAVTAAGLFTWALLANLPLWIEGLVTWILGASYGFWGQVVYYPLVVGTGILLFVASIFVSYLLHVLIAIPFYALLAERTLIIFGVKQDRPFQFSRWIRTSLRMFRVSLVKTVLFLMIGAVLFVVSFVPVINVIAIFGTLLLMSFDLLDYSLETMEFGLRQRIGFVLKNKKMWAGMACGLGLTLVVPGLTLVIAPGAVVGAALLLHEASERN